MKAILCAVVILFATSTASAAVLCRSNSDPSYSQCFPGWTCPFGVYQIGGC